MKEDKVAPNIFSYWYISNSASLHLCALVERCAKNLLKESSHKKLVDIKVARLELLYKKMLIGHFCKMSLSDRKFASPVLV